MKCERCGGPISTSSPYPAHALDAGGCILYLRERVEELEARPNQPPFSLIQGLSQRIAITERYKMDAAPAWVASVEQRITALQIATRPVPPAAARAEEKREHRAILGGMVPDVQLECGTETWHTVQVKCLRRDGSESNTSMNAYRPMTPPDAEQRCAYDNGMYVCNRSPDHLMHTDGLHHAFVPPTRLAGLSGHDVRMQVRSSDAEPLCAQMTLCASPRAFHYECNGTISHAFVPPAASGQRFPNGMKPCSFCGGTPCCCTGSTNAPAVEGEVKCIWCHHPISHSEPCGVEKASVCGCERPLTQEELNVMMDEDDAEYRAGQTPPPIAAAVASEKPQGERTWTLHGTKSLAVPIHAEGPLVPRNTSITVVEVSEQRKVRLHRYKVAIVFSPWMSCPGECLSPELYEHADALLIGEEKT